MDAAAFLNLRVFLEGIEVPAIGARIVASPGSPVVCEVQLVATDQVYDLKPRTAVAVCIFDDDRIGHAYNTGSQVKRPNLAHDDLRNYKVGFLGELSGIAFQKRPGQRDVTLLFAAPDNYWEFIRQHYVNFRNGGIELIELAFNGVSRKKAQSFDVGGKDLHSNLYNWLSKEGNLYKGVHRILREMWFAANDWYGRAYNRWRYGDLLVGVPGDKTAAKLYESQFFQKYLTGRIGGAGGAYSLQQVVQMVLGSVFHQDMGVPFPYLDAAGRARAYDPKDKSAYFRRQIKRDAGWEKATLNYTLILPHMPFAAPPACNIVFPNQYNIQTLNRNYLAEPTRLFVRTSLLLNGGANKWLTERFYAPDFESIVGEGRSAERGAFLERLAATVLPHERWTGLNPREHWQDDISAYVAKGPRRGYLSKLADYMYWLQRFAPRTMSFTGPLNMNLVAGLPALVMSDVYPEDHLAKHVQGYLASVIHMIDQRGGITQGTLTHVRHHTEVLDFDADASTSSDDGAGANYRSLEELVDRGSDGFLDDRYDVKNIGAEVYDLLLGCGSLYDLGQQLASEINPDSPEASLPLVPGGDKTWSDIDGDKHSMRKAIWALEIIWRRNLNDGGSLRSLAREVTWRPKASLVEVLGRPSDLVQDDPDLQAIYDEEGIPEEGFLSSAFDPEAYSVNAGDVYKRVTYRFKKRFNDNVSVTLKPGETGIAITGNREDGTLKEISVTAGPDGTIIRTSRPEADATENETTAKYGLRDDMEVRRDCVQKYANSLLPRGLG
jgi:hypothetical protein